MKSLIQSVYTWANQRLDLDDMLHFAEKKTVPEHRHAAWYYWGGVSLFFFLVQAVSGVLLLLYYRPGPDAFESVRQITFDIHFGWLIRSTHSWAANLMLVSIFVHMFSVFFMKAYRSPREFGWWSGIGLLVMAMVFGFSGYLLPMNELAYFATKVGLEIPASMPVIGPVMDEYCRLYPEVQLDVQLDDRIGNWVEDRIDVGFRLGNSPQEGLVARRFSNPMTACSTPWPDHRPHWRGPVQANCPPGPVHRSAPLARPPATRYSP